jgi:hypothetical protein
MSRKVWFGGEWVELCEESGGVVRPILTASLTEPASPAIGDVWIDPSGPTATAWDGAAWDTIPTDHTIQVFLTSGTWTKPSDGTLTTVRRYVYGSGGGGGSGISAGTNRHGGGGGGGGELSFDELDIGDMGATETVVVGVGGTGAAGVTNAGGLTGSNGTNSSITATGGATLTGNAGSGGVGKVGAATATGGAGGTGGGGLSGGTGGDGGTFNADPGGGGGGATTDQAVWKTFGGPSPDVVSWPRNPAGTNLNGVAGGPGLSTDLPILRGTGGAPGTTNTGGAADGHGGAGGWPSGGGGGSGPGNSTALPSGNAGNGANGLVIVVCA